MTNQTVAQIILEQLGGNRFVAMTGSRQFVDLDRGLQFKFPRKRGVNCCRVTLDEGDLYTLEFWLITPTKTEWILKYRMVSVENLRGVFTEVTGMDTSL